VESQSLPADSGNYPQSTRSSTALQQLKTDAMAWVNKIFPLTAQFPATFALRALSVTVNLTTLATLVGQLKAGPFNDAVAQQIKLLCGQMVQTVSPLQSQSTDLSNDLKGFAAAMRTDHMLSQTEAQTLWTDQGTVHGTFASANGQLQHEMSRTCPNEGTINALRRTIQQAFAELAAIHDLLALFQNAANQTGQCSQSLEYLANYWTTLAADVVGCVQALQRASTDAASLLSFDLGVVQSQWHQTLTFLQQASAAATAKT
jgi:hypothetical protein